MCDRCGCEGPHRVSIDVHASLFRENDRQAQHLREHFMDDAVLTLNVMGSPGSGKTALLEATAQAVSGRLRLAAVSGDLATALDAERLSRAGITSAAITTGSACHLDAAMIHHALHDPKLSAAVHEADIFFIENVGNLICPAIYDLGQAANIVVLSVTEGVDKPLKYPVMFRNADLVVLTKVDLLPHLGGVRTADFLRALGTVMPRPNVIELSPVTGDGVLQFVSWLDERRSSLDRARTPSRTRPPLQSP